MATIRYGSHTYTLSPEESVLDCLERHGVAPANSCRAGRCQSCVMRCHSGEIPEQAQAQLRETWRRRNYFLSCMCRPTDDLEITRIDAAEQQRAQIVALDRLSDTVTRVRLSLIQVPEDWTYEPGQFISLVREDNMTRSYCLASLAHEDTLEFHVRWQVNGRMSTWLHQEAKVGDEIEIRGPLGECFYTDDQPKSPLLLLATGSGLGPIWAIAREAMRQHHEGPIVLIHGAKTPAGLYMRDELRALADAHAQLSYIACVSEPPEPEDAGLTVAKLTAVASREYGHLSESAAPVRGYVCGEPEDIKALKLELFLSGLPLRSIISEAFVTATLDTKRDSNE